MKPLLLLLGVLTGICWGRDDAAPLDVHLVHKEKFASSRFVDTPEHPKLGYVSAQPDLRITSLKHVIADPTPWTELGKGGKVIGSGWHYAVLIGFADKEGKDFEAFTRAHVGKKVAMFVGDKILYSVVLGHPVTGGGMRLTCANEDQMVSLEKALKPLVTP